MNIKEIQQKNCEMCIPTGWNIYEWAEKYPGTVIAAALKRIEKIFDFSDSIQGGFSGGKDSTVTADLACLEVNLRRLRVQNQIMRDGTPGIDPLDKKWENKRVHFCMTDAEVVFTSTNDYAKRFLAKYGPEGLDVIEFNWICLPLAWQSGVSFDSGILISWDPEKKNMWVQDMPTKEELHGFTCINVDNRRTANAIPLSKLPIHAQKFHREHGNVEMVDIQECFGVSPDDKGTVEAVANFGRGPILPNFKPACHEKEEQDDYSYEFAQSAWLLDYRTKEEREACRKRLEELYNLKKDVWFLTPAKVDSKDCPDEWKETSIASCLISLRAEESLDRRVILSQGEYSTGQYSRNQGTNICSPVFDFKAEDIWRILSATDWDVNDVYEKLYEIGVGIGDQRVGSLLNYAAVRQVATVKALEPDLYGRINQRFSNVEFMAQFSRSSYFRISKPKDSNWDGKNHIKAGVPEEELDRISDEYESILKEFGIPYRRDGWEFWTEDPKLKGRPWFPLKTLLETVK